MRKVSAHSPDSITYKRDIIRYIACALTALGPLEVVSPQAIAQLPIRLIRPHPDARVELFSLRIGV